MEKLAFYRKYHRVISPEEYEQFAESAKPLLIILSSLHCDTLSDLDEARAQGNVFPKATTPLPFTLFQITEHEAGQYSLSDFYRRLVRKFLIPNLKQFTDAYVH